MTRQEFENNWEIIKKFPFNATNLDKGIKDDYEILCNTPIRSHKVITDNSLTDFQIEFTLDNKIGNKAIYNAGTREEHSDFFYDKVSFGWGAFPLKYLPQEYSSIVESYTKDIQNLIEQYQQENNSCVESNEESQSNKRKKQR